MISLGVNKHSAEIVSMYQSGQRPKATKAEQAEEKIEKKEEQP